MDPMLTLIMVASLPIVGVIVFYVSRKMRSFKIVQKASDSMLRVVRENAGVRVIKGAFKIGL